MKIEATHLGKLTPYPPAYDPSVLVAVPRKLNREQYLIDDDELPFCGVDVWHAYEFGFMIQSGLPVVGLLKIVYPAKSYYLVESKSLKLYLNSFNMERIGEVVKEGVEKVLSIIKNDLSHLLKCKVDVAYFNHNSKFVDSDFNDFEILEEKVYHIECKIFNEDQELLDVGNEHEEIKWGTHLLRSNCKITNQPDWGSIYVNMKSEHYPSKEGFLKYIVSLRNENHFHEEICEMVYHRLYQKYQPSELMVSCLYTRRGGIDINPVRSTNADLYPVNLVSQTSICQSGYRQ